MSAATEGRPVEDLMHTPTVPNYVLLRDGGASVDIRCIPDAILRRIAKRWTKALIDNAHKRRRSAPAGSETDSNG